MPELFRQYGFIFLFFSHEHGPIHVHVEGHNGNAKFTWDKSQRFETDRKSRTRKFRYNRQTLV